MNRTPVGRWIDATLEWRHDEVPRSPQFRRFLVHCLLRHPSVEVRIRCAHYAAFREGGDVRAALERCAGNLAEDPRVRGRALHALGRRRVKRPRGLLLSCLGDASPVVRFWGCYLAGLRGGGRFRSRLTELLSDQELGDTGLPVSEYARCALMVLDGLAVGIPVNLSLRAPVPRPEVLPEKWLELIRAHASGKLPKTGECARALAYWVRHHEDPHIRHWCGCLSFRPPDSATLEWAFCCGASDPDEHPVVRGNCLEVLSVWEIRSGWPTPETCQSAQVVAACLNDPDGNVRFWACYQAAHLPECEPMLKRLLDDQAVGIMGWTVGYEAGEALKEIRGKVGWEHDPERLPHPYEEIWW